MKSLEVLFTPAEFASLKQRDLSDTMCVVFDVLRATSSMVTALANGAAGIIPVEEVEEALAWRERQPDVLLAGEREGLRIKTAAGNFDLGNSPREFTAAAVKGKTIVMTTTNGTRALRACAKAQSTLAASLLNLTATADFIRQIAPARLLVVCSGTYEEAAYEDALGAGALCHVLWPELKAASVADSALVAVKLWQQKRSKLFEAVSESRNGRRLLDLAGLQEDVAYCVQRDLFPCVARVLGDRVVEQGQQ